LKAAEFCALSDKLNTKDKTALLHAVLSIMIFKISNSMQKRKTLCYDKIKIDKNSQFLKIFSRKLSNILINIVYNSENLSLDKLPK
jgi:hypothetical protein